MDPSGRDAGLVFLFRNQLWQPISFFDFAPSSVYHYTTGPALTGILKDNSIRATNFTFLNDPSEVRYGYDLVIRLLSDIRATAPDSQLQLLDAIETALSQEMLAEVYVSCFSSLGDDLSQWRAYGSSALERYSIGFDTEVLERIGNSETTISFAKVLYKHDEQIPRAQFYVDRALKFIVKNDIARENWPAVAAVTAELLARVIPELKNPAYAHEQEWRLIRWHRASENNALDFDTSRGVLRPFLATSLPTPIPVNDVLIMAPSRKDVALKGTEMLLRNANVDVLPRHSTIPFAD